MYCINDTNCFTLTRGDTFEFPLVINKNNNDIDFELYPLTDADTIYVAILEPNQSFEDAIIRKVITKDSPTDTENHPLLRLSSADTEFLRTGKYFITIKLQHNEDVTTLLQMKEFWITGTSKTPVKPLKFRDDPEYNYEDYEIIYDGGVIE